MPRILGPWKVALIDISESTTLSAAVDLENECADVLVLIPTITSSTVTLTISNDNSTFYPLHEFVPIGNSNSITNYPVITTAAVTSLAIVFHIGGARWIKVLCGSAQTTTDKTFYVRGIK